MQNTFRNPSSKVGESLEAPAFSFPRQPVDVISPGDPHGVRLASATIGSVVHLTCELHWPVNQLVDLGPEQGLILGWDTITILDMA